MRCDYINIYIYGKQRLIINTCLFVDYDVIVWKSVNAFHRLNPLSINSDRNVERLVCDEMATAQNETWSNCITFFMVNIKLLCMVMASEWWRNTCVIAITNTHTNERLGIIISTGGVSSDCNIEWLICNFFRLHSISILSSVWCFVSAIEFSYF